MAIEAEFTGVLAGALSSLVSDRVFPAGGRQGAAYPYVTYQRISTDGAAYLDGPNDLEWPRFQFDVWADTPLSALTVAEAIRTAIDNVDHGTFLATFQDQRGPTADEQTRKFGVSQDYFIWHERI